MKEEEKKAKPHFKSCLFPSTFRFQNSSCCLRCCPVIIWISKSKPPLLRNRGSRATQGTFCSIWRLLRWRACWGTRGNLEHYSESTHHDIWSNYGRSNGNTNSSWKWILSSKRKGWSYSILGWHDVWTLLKLLWWRQSGIRTRLKIKGLGGGTGYELTSLFHWFSSTLSLS